jgi:hypothetical protein
VVACSGKADVLLTWNGAQLRTALRLVLLPVWRRAVRSRSRATMRPFSSLNDAQVNAFFGNAHRSRNNVPIADAAGCLAAGVQLVRKSAAVGYWAAGVSAAAGAAGYVARRAQCPPSFLSNPVMRLNGAFPRRWLGQNTVHQHFTGLGAGVEQRPRSFRVPLVLRFV